MKKIASPQDLQAELQRLLTYSQGQNPSRERLAADLNGLADRVAKGDEVIAAKDKDARIEKFLAKWSEADAKRMDMVANFEDLWGQAKRVQSDLSLATLIRRRESQKADLRMKATQFLKDYTATMK